jgi:regulatory protein
LTIEEIINKLESYCAYSERCIEDVKLKLLQLKADPEWYDKVIEYLVENKFISEERFVSQFISGKIRIKQWGRIKIKHELKKKRISESLINKHISAIDADAYYETIKSVMLKKLKELKKETPEQKKYKLFKYAYSRGFEPDITSDAIDEIIKSIC